MGGNLLKSRGGEGRRISTPEKGQIETLLLGKLEQATRRVACVESLRDKPDHGDIDIFIDPLPAWREPVRTREPGENAPVPPPKWFEGFSRILGAAPIHLNGKVGTYDFDGVQIDLIAAEPATFENILAYMRFSPLGNILGTMIKFATGTHWGEQGLFAPVIPNPAKPDQVIAYSTFSTDPEDVARLAGLDYPTWLRGFDTAEDLYAFLIQSPLFAKEAFADNNLTHKHRIREKRREDYEGWRTFCKEQPDKLENPDAGKARLNTLFPTLAGELAAITKNAQLQLEARRTKFNAGLAREWTGIAETDVPQFFKAFRKNWDSRAAYETWIDSHTQAEIRAFVLKFQRTIDTQPNL